MIFPDFSMIGSDEKQYNIENISKSKMCIFYFYPKDNTPGCTVESKDFSCLKQEFLNLDIDIIGVSSDGVQSHKKFINNHELEVLLLVDENNELAKKLGVWGEKNNYGKKYQGIIRSTFLVNLQSKEIIKEWRNVRAKGHAERVLDFIKNT